MRGSQSCAARPSSTSWVAKMSHFLADAFQAISSEIPSASTDRPASHYRTVVWHNQVTEVIRPPLRTLRHAAGRYSDRPSLRRFCPREDDDRLPPMNP